MTAWLWVGIVLAAGGLAPGLLLASRGSAVERLVGLELTAAVATVEMLVLTVAFGQSSYLIVPLVFVLLAFAGTLVFTRLMAPPS